MIEVGGASLREGRGFHVPEPVSEQVHGSLVTLSVHLSATWLFLPGISWYTLVSLACGT